MKLRLDLAHPGPSPALAGWLMLGVGGLAIVLSLVYWQRAQTEHDKMAARLADLAPATLPSTGVADSKDDAGKKTAQRLLRADWQAMLTALERSRPRNIALIRIDADAGSGVIKLNAVAKSHDDMLAYLRTLQVQSGLREVTLVRHDDQDQDEVAQVAFSVQALWGRP